MPKSPNNWKKPAGSSISTNFPPIHAEINFNWCCIKITRAAPHVRKKKERERGGKEGEAGWGGRNYLKSLCSSPEGCRRIWGEENDLLSQGGEGGGEKKKRE